MPQHTFILNGAPVSVDCPDDLRVLWVLRDLLGIQGPKYGCAGNVCKACTCHINGRAFAPCSVPISQIKPNDQVTTIEGLAATSGGGMHPVQQAWIEHDVAQCGFCQPGQIMAATAKIKQLKAQGRSVTDADLDEIRNVCRCGTYPRIRAAIKSAAARM
jgi:isoquinoline 1-oxidoreductase subunit alpha